MSPSSTSAPKHYFTSDGVVAADTKGFLPLQEPSQSPSSTIPCPQYSELLESNGTNERGISPESTTARLSHVDGSASVFRPVPAYTPSHKLRIVTIGAGFSGMIFAHKLRYEHPEMEQLVSNTIFEARAEIGGTWLVNTYPGVQCDVPSHIYAFPFDPYPDWSRFYSTGPEIQEYLVRTVRKWDLDRDVRFNTRVTGLWWEEENGRWKINVQHNGQEETHYADFVVSGQGFLNTWKWPEIPGLQDFKGHKVHSAAWDHGYDYSRQRIAIIGNGSSGIQILPQLAKLEGTDIVSFQRSPTWVVNRLDPFSLLGKTGGSSNPPYTEEEKKIFREDSRAHWDYRRKIIHAVNRAFRMYVKDSPENLENTEFAAKQMAEKLNHDPELCEKLIPKWELGCRRITPGEGYLECFLQPNVHLSQSRVKQIKANSIVTEDGKEYPVDCIVCATGFDVSHCPSYPVIGRRNTSLAERWKDEPESYLSLACSDFPNYFIFTGPNAVVGHGSLVEGLGWCAEYMIKWFKKVLMEDVRSIEPRAEALQDFVRYGDVIQRTLTWTGACRSWYKKGRVDGRVTATFPGSALLFKRMISEVRGEDWKIQYNSANRFRFMGNGFTDYELDAKNDLSWYVKEIKKDGPLNGHSGTGKLTNGSQMVRGHRPSMIPGVDL